MENRAAYCVGLDYSCASSAIFIQQHHLSWLMASYTNNHRLMEWRNTCNYFTDAPISGSGKLANICRSSSIFGFCDSLEKKSYFEFGSGRLWLKLALSLRILSKQSDVRSEVPILRRVLILWVILYIGTCVH